MRIMWTMEFQFMRFFSEEILATGLDVLWWTVGLESRCVGYVLRT